jgi:mannose-6-phosphate isomerase-like protein (cupin superfamily)
MAAGMRAGMAAGEDPGALVAGMHGHLAPQAVADWQAALTAVQRLDQVGAGPVGYRGMSMGCGLGVPLIAAEPRIRAAVLGLLGVHGLAEDAARITVPVRFLVQWDDRMVPRDQSLALFDALSSTENYVLGQELRVTILTSAEETEGRHDLTDSVMPPGAATPLHLHTAYEERLWVVSGSLTVWAGEATVTLRSGDFYTIPLNTSHAIASGPEGARALNISSPAGFAELIARAGTPLHLATDQTELDVDLFNAVAEELGDRVMGPPGTTPADLP